MMVAENPLPPGLLIAAPRSGAGKTTLTLGLLRALKLRGVCVQPFKCGPDYIDPAFHEAASGRASYNIDSWAMSWPLAAAALAESRNPPCDIAIAEGLMGLFDGVATSGQWGTGASADIAARTGWPVVLVIDISGQSQTAAAQVKGFIGFREGVDIAGVILNRAGSERHIRLVRSSLESLGISVLGALPRDNTVALPERHLGLVQAGETVELGSRLDALARFVEANVDVGRLIEVARSAFPPVAVQQRIRPPGQRIALAQDAAFSFVYPHVLKAWREAGSEIRPFSPLADEEPHPAADVVWLPGGYPELHGATLASANRFRAAITRFAETRPIHGECGGYMVLGAGLEDAGGHRHQMLGLLGLETSFARRGLHLGYRQARIEQNCCLGPKGGRLRGHEFHYATALASPDEPLFGIEDSDGNKLADGGARRKNVTGSFFHLIESESE